MKNEVQLSTGSLVITKNPKVSVVIPTYKRPQLLLRAIKSVLAQTEQNFEIIVVDDGSNDETASVVGLLQDSRIHFFAFSENRGGSVARNKGVSIATGTYVAFLDSDDYWLPQKLEKQVALAQEIGPLNEWLIYNALGNVRDDGMRMYKTGVFSPGDTISTFLIREGNHVLSSGLFMLKSTALKYPFDESLRRFQDTDLVIRMAEAKVPFFLCDEPTVIWCDDGTYRISHSTHSEFILFWMNKMGTRLSSYARSSLMIEIAQIEWSNSLTRSIYYWTHALYASPGTVIAFSRDFLLSLIPVKSRRFLKKQINRFDVFCKKK